MIDEKHYFYIILSIFVITTEIVMVKIVLGDLLIIVGLIIFLTTVYRIRSEYTLFKEISDIKKGDTPFRKFLQTKLSQEARKNVYLEHSISDLKALLDELNEINVDVK